MRSVTFQYSCSHTLTFCSSLPGSDIRIWKEAERVRPAFLYLFSSAGKRSFCELMEGAMETCVSLNTCMLGMHN